MSIAEDADKPAFTAGGGDVSGNGHAASGAARKEPSWPSPSDFPVSHADVFPHGAYVVPDVTPVSDSVSVKIAAKHQPVPPEVSAGTPFAPVEFDGLSALPYIDDSGNFARIA